MEKLNIEVEHLKELDFDIDLLALPDDLLEIDLENEMGSERESVYTNKITTPIYEIKGDKPNLEDLCDTSKVLDLINEIENADVPQEIKSFLTVSAYRHAKFNYEKIAEYYAHASIEVKELFENSALVIVDYDKALELGYIKLTKSLMEASDER